MFGFAIFAVGLVLIVLWIRHDRNKPWVPSGSMRWKEITLVFLALVAIIVVGIIRSSALI